MRIVFCLEVVAPQSCEALVEEGAYLAAQLLDDLVAGVAGLTVDEAYQDESLGDGEVLQFLGILLGDFVLGLFHQALAFALVGDVRQDRIVFLHLRASQFGVREHLFHIVSQAAALARVGDLQVALH